MCHTRKICDFLYLRRLASDLGGQTGNQVVDRLGTQDLAPFPQPHVDCPLCKKKESGVSRYPLNGEDARRSTPASSPPKKSKTKINQL